MLTQPQKARGYQTPLKPGVWLKRRIVTVTYPGEGMGPAIEDGHGPFPGTTKAGQLEGVRQLGPHMTQSRRRSDGIKKVELHIHLDGAVRPSTAWEYAQKKKISIPGVETLDQFKKACTVTKPSNLNGFLQKFGLFWPPLEGDLDAMERMAYEFCEDESKAGVIYAEPRYSPRIALGEKALAQLGPSALDEVIVRISHGLERGRKDFGVKTKQILCARYSKDFNDMTEVLRQCQKHFDKGVVGIDLLTLQPPGVVIDEAPLEEPVVSVYREAAKTGIHRTVHAAEVGTASAVDRAVYKLGSERVGHGYHVVEDAAIYKKCIEDQVHFECCLYSSLMILLPCRLCTSWAVYKLGSERVGHGYHVVEDAAIYKKCIKDQVHFECCPYSSLMTGSVKAGGENHPICRFARDGANFSVSDDDPIVTGHTLVDDYELLKSWGISRQQLANANINACNASFLSSSEKNELLRELINDKWDLL
ncbi:adenosine deaminase-like [Macrosteles quadrilineatus]|uniref:adenosine deaminase-like n=1 Tax=Macrosteles quadrilineatus TaxID=74068 RepID=UPI0023E10490|nr:adenosine deaminase-like [Macrosteles quadrilineatus]